MSPSTPLRPALLAAALCLPVLAQESEEAPPPPKRALEHADCMEWMSLYGARLSVDGQTLSYTLSPADRGDGVLMIHDLAEDAEYRVERGSSASFERTARQVYYLIQPSKEEREKAREEQLEPAEQPRAELVILSLPGGETERHARVRSFAVPAEAGGFLAWLEEDPSPLPAGVEDTDEAKRRGRDLVLRAVESGDEHRYGCVSSYRFSPEGRRLLLQRSLPDETHSLALVDTGSGEELTLDAGKNEYRSWTFAENGERLAFLARLSEGDDRPWTLYLWSQGEARAFPLVTRGTQGIPAGWIVSENRSPAFSDSGNRLFFGTAPEPPEEPEEVDEEDRVVLDVWSWTDELLQPMQLRRVASERRRTYLAVAHVHSAYPRVVQLATEEVPDVSLAQGRDSDLALGVTDQPYVKMMSWDTQTYKDVWLIDPISGKRHKWIEKRRGSFSLSPEGRYVTWWDGEARAWFGRAIGGDQVVELSAGIPHPVHNELADQPALPGNYGSAGWLAGDEGRLLYDKHDLWLCDPTGELAPRCLTEGLGRRRDLRFRLVRLDTEEPGIAFDEPLLLSAFGLHSKVSGFFRDRIAGTAEPEELVLEPCSFSRPAKAEEADVLHFTRSTFAEFPDVWISDLDFAERQRVSCANPIQDEFRWGTAELFEWTAPDGESLQGILCLPEDFDPEATYPMVVYFYERNSDSLHSYSSPVPGGSSIRYPFYTSRGYVVFVPDIPYRIGEPGPSAQDAVISGIEAVLSRGYVDPERVGVQGHSWGGYQIAYLVTKANTFAAAIAGAPVSNMTSAYGGIRWSTGMSRMFQYEKTQSRIGGTLWEALDKYIANSPVFFADRVETPLLMLHNDEDGAVPWYQGIEYFVALRRLGKPVWLLNYNGEGHGLGKLPNRKDYAIRMQQFFDHYLKDAAPPAWMVEGVPAIDKGRDLGLDLVDEE